MRRLSHLLVVVVVVIVAWCSVSKDVSRAAAASVPSCTSASVRITDYNTVVGTGHVNDLFWIKNVSHQACTLRGYVRAAFIGVYGVGTPYKNPHRLKVRETHLYGRAGNALGGINDGRPIPTVTVQPEGGVASIWLDGTDIQVGNPPGRCINSRKMLAWLPGSSTPLVVLPLRANGFFWCGAFSALPILPGESGSEPSRPLSYFFGTSVELSSPGGGITSLKNSLDECP